MNDSPLVSTWCQIFRVYDLKGAFTQALEDSVISWMQQTDPERCCLKIMHYKMLTAFISIGTHKIFFSCKEDTKLGEPQVK